MRFGVSSWAYDMCKMMPTMSQKFSRSSKIKFVTMKSILKTISKLLEKIVKPIFPGLVRQAQQALAGN